MRLTLNISPCPNDTFMFDALVNGRIDTRDYEFDVTFADIEELNGRVMDGTASTPHPDISKISYAVLPAIADRYALLESGSALGHGNGPVLVARPGFRLHTYGMQGGEEGDVFYRERFPDGNRRTESHLVRDEADGNCGMESHPVSDEVDGNCDVESHPVRDESIGGKYESDETPHSVGMCPVRVAVPGIHTTANRLLQRLFPELTDRRPVLFSEIAPAVARGEFDAGVLIHEGRFTYRDHGLELIADLGVEWERTTGLPLPLGAIVASRTLPPAVRRDIEEMIRESIEYAFARPAASREFVKAHAQEMDDKTIESHIALFVNDNSLYLSPQARRAIELLTGIAV